MNTIRMLVALWLTAWLVACAPLGGAREELSIWGLELNAKPADGTAVTWQLVVDEPEASGPLSGARIVLAPQTGAFGVFRGARWTDRAPALVQTLIVRGFEDSARIIGVGRTSASVRGDFALLTELRAFHADRSGTADEVVVSIAAKLVRYSTSDVRAARVFEARIPVTGSGIGAVVAAFQIAVNEIIPQLVDWSLRVGAANAAASNPPPGRNAAQGLGSERKPE